jgi:hypothetical protein
MPVLSRRMAEAVFPNLASLGGEARFIAYRQSRPERGVTELTVIYAEGPDSAKFRIDAEFESAGVENFLDLTPDKVKILRWGLES